MKGQRIENFDSFDPDEWNPVDDKVFSFQVNQELYTGKIQIVHGSGRELSNWKSGCKRWRNATNEP